MNLSIYIKLWIANAFGKVKIKPNFKHLKFMRDNRYISPKLDDKAEPTPEPGPYLKDWYTITSKGKEAMWNMKSHIVSRTLAIIAIIISALSLVVSFTTKLL